MGKKLLIICMPALLLLVANKTFSRETNSHEDYSAYLQDVRAINKYFTSLPKGGSILTKEGLEAARNAGPNIPVKSPPSVKNIPGPSGNLVIRIFKPDTIRAVVMSIHGGGWSVGTAESDDVLNDY